MRPEDDRTSDRTTRRLPVSEAAKALGLSAEAIRQRVKRDTIPHTKIGGTVYVLLDQDLIDRYAEERRRDTDQTPLVDSLQDQVAYLREELHRREEVHREESRRKDSIIAALTSRLPELPPPTPPEIHEQDHARHDSHEKATESAAQDQVRVDPQATNPEPHRAAPWRAWFRRIFG